MEELLTELKKYEQYSIQYKLSKVEEIFSNESFLTSFVENTNKEIASDYISEEDRFTVYFYIYKKEELYAKPMKLDFNTFCKKVCSKSKLLSQPYMFGNPTILGHVENQNSIRHLLDEIETNKKLDISDFEVKYFIFTEKQKKLNKNFNKLFFLIKDTCDSVNNKFIDTKKSFLVDSYDFLARNKILSITILTLLIFYYNRYKLIYLGVPSEIIFDLEVISVLKLLMSVFLPFIIVPVVGLALYFYKLLALDSSMGKQEFYNSLKTIVSFIFYPILVLIVINFVLIKFDAKKISTDDMFLTEYFYESYYPRFAKSQDSQLLLILGEEKRKIYYYNLKDFQVNKNNEELCSVLKKKKYEGVVIALLKNSKYSNTKTIIKATNIAHFDILDENSSLALLKERYCIN